MKDLSVFSLFMTVTLLAGLMTITSVPAAMAQEQCGTMEIQKKRAEQFPELYGTQQFEDWLQKEKIRQQQGFKTQRTEETLITIPVVVHVIHRPGDAEGVASNVSLERIERQIEILNEDFRRQNADASQTPEKFEPVAADINVEFVLAKQDPEGLATNGVVRIANEQSFNNAIFKLTEISYWPPEDYLNVYVTSLTTGVLGYSSFPAADLPGLEDPSNENGEGVVIGWQYLGDVGEYRGRTATHEVGHYLGLRHIWGDGDCSVDDYCEDTPPAFEANYDCHSEPLMMCGEESMYMNFMDYTKDRCMNLFTLDQKDRIRLVLSSAPRRKTLASSPGALAPSQVNYDAGIRQIFSPTEGSCTDEPIVPQIEIRNYGTATLNTVQIEMVVDGAVKETININASIAPLDTRNVTFSPYTFDASGTHNVAFRISKVNGSTDENANNDLRETSTIVQPAGNLPQVLTFETGGLPAGWTIYNQDDYTTWEVVNAPTDIASNQAISMQYESYRLFRGSKDRIYSPVYDLSGFLNASMEFSLSYSVYPDYEYDRLRVKVISGCEFGPQSETVVFDKRGYQLATTTPRSDSYVPSSSAEWNRFTIDLTPFTGMDHVTVVIEGENGYGNNLYLDDIIISGIIRQDTDLTVNKILNPTSSVCLEPQTPYLEVRNVGRKAAESFVVEYTLNNGDIKQATYSGQPLAPGESRLIEIPEITPVSGVNEFTATIFSSGSEDQNKENDSKSVSFLATSDKDNAPLRINFENGTLNNWSEVSQGEASGWEIVSDLHNGTNTAIVAPYYGSSFDQIGEEAWFVSPVIDFSEAPEPSLTFMHSYAQGLNATDTLHVMVSADCGESYTKYASLFGQALGSRPSTSQPWEPDTLTEWNQAFINLSAFAGMSDVKLAFVAVNNRGNNIYLDDIAINATQQSGNNLQIEPDEFIIFPNPAGNEELFIGFNMQEKQDVEIMLINSLGEVMVVESLPNILNQVHRLDMTLYPGGLYFVKVKSPATESVKKVLLVR